EEKQVARLEEQLGQRQARSLAAGEAAHDAERVVAVEAEAREVLARRLDGEVAADPADVVDGGERRVDLAQVLVEVPLLQVGPALHGAAVLAHPPPGEDLEERRLPRAVGPDDADALAATNERLDAVEQRAPAALGVEPFDVEHDVAAAVRRREAERDLLR